MAIKNLQRDFDLLVAAAVAGDRCPFSQPHGPIRVGSISALIAANKIKSEVYRHNYRVVTILEGEHRGKRTAPAPAGSEPWRVNGVRVHRLMGRVSHVV